MCYASEHIEARSRWSIQYIDSVIGMFLAHIPRLSIYANEFARHVLEGLSIDSSSASDNFITIYRLNH